MSKLKIASSLVLREFHMNRRRIEEKGRQRQNEYIAKPLDVVVMLRTIKETLK